MPDLASRAPIVRWKRKAFVRFLVSLTCASLVSALWVNAAFAAGSVVGTVFRDHNSNGVRDTGELGVAGVTVTAYDSSGTSLASTTTASDGSYVLTSLPDDVRIEVTNYPSYLNPGPKGTNSQTTVAFASTPAVNVDIGLAYPRDYCQSNPDLCTSVMINGDPLGGGTSGTQMALAGFAYSNAGTSPSPTSIASNSEIGSTWGLAWRPSTETVYAAAFLRRHAGLGPLGSGGIYAVDMSSATPVVSSFLDFDALGIDTGTVPSNAARGLDANAIVANQDPNAFALVGKAGLGDMDISDDESTLWVVNLFNQALYSIAIDSDNNPATTPTLSDISSYPIPDPGCSGGDWRPFGLKYYQGDLYVGGVCDAATSSNVTDLTATVYRFSSGTFTSILSFTLDYAKGEVLTSAFAPAVSVTTWWPWMDTQPGSSHLAPFDYIFIYPQPILSDIEFDTDGFMIMGFADRNGYQHGDNNYRVSSTLLEQGMVGGDILISYDNSGTYVLESNGSAGTVTSASGVGNGEGPGGGEFYDQDILTFFHFETSSGGLAVLPDSDQVATTAIDTAAGGLHTGGINYFSNSNGSLANNYMVYNGNMSSGLFGKAGGLGDLELLCEAAPIEIGNRVWFDADKDGIQDPDETPLANVDVTLASGGSDGVLGTSDDSSVTIATNSQGLYYFSSQSYPNDVLFNTEMRVSVDLSDPDLMGYSPTTMDYLGNSGTSNLRDSDGDDGVILAGFSSVNFTTGSPGENDHTYDFGFSEPSTTPSTTSSESQLQTASQLPETGFVPGQQTALPAQIGDQSPLEIGQLRLEIPALDINIPITGIPFDDATWDLSGLLSQAGYLQGTSFPTLQGNTVLSAHNYLPSGLPGPFNALDQLRYGDRIIISAWGQDYVYEVRSNEVVSSRTMRVLGHSEQNLLTLLTCKTYDERIQSYRQRVAVQAVLIKVESAQ